MITLLGIDIGTTGSKASLFSAEGVLLAESYVEYELEQSRTANEAELSPQVVWQAVQRIITEVVLKVPNTTVKALSIASLGEVVVPVDQHGNVLSNAILYVDPRGTEQSKLLEQKIGSKRIMEITGVPNHPMFSLPKMMWIKQNQPEIYSKTWKFMLFGDFIAYKLTGESATDYSLASRTMALNVAKKEWDSEMLRAADVEIDKLPRLILSGEVIGEVRATIASSLGLQSTTLVVAGGHDQACAALGAGILSSNQAVDGIGTVECITPVYSQPVLNSKMLESQYNCAPHVINGLYLTYAFNFTGGSILKWYRDYLGKGAQYEAEKQGMSIYDYLNKTASASPTELLVIPHFAGSGTPYMNPDAKGTIYGLRLNTSAEELYRALMEGVTYEMRYNLQCLADAGITINSLRAVGGGAKSDLWLQIKADIMNLPIERLNINEAGTTGNIILGGTAAGVYSSIEEAIDILVKPIHTFEPNPKHAEWYEQQYIKYKQLSRVINEIH